MNELIKVIVTAINHETVNAVNARDLWKFLESKRKFGDWIKDRLDGFTEGQDFTVHKIVKGEDGRFRPTEYIISLDAAKHIAMLERNEQGRKIRQYFIEVEKQYREWEKAAVQKPKPEDGDADSDIFIENAWYQERRVVPTWLLASRLGISPELLRIFSNSSTAGLINGKDIFRLRNVSDRFLSSMRKAGFAVRDDFRSINLYTPSGASKIIELLKRSGLEEREQMVVNECV